MKADAWTEEAWLTFSTLNSVWEANCLWPRLTERKCRLFAVACCRRIWRYIPDDGSKWIIDTLECVADGALGESEWQGICRDYARPQHSSQSEGRALSAVVTCIFDTDNRLAHVAAMYCAAAVSVDESLGEARQDEERRQCVLLREMFGNPFRPVEFDPAWRTTDVRLLAEGIYDERAFDRMPILADALQDAGCDSDNILSHLRDTNATHVRGCWALDLVLEKE